MQGFLSRLHHRKQIALDAVDILYCYLPSIAQDDEAPHRIDLFHNAGGGFIAAAVPYGRFRCEAWDAYVGGVFLQTQYYIFVG